MSKMLYVIGIVEIIAAYIAAAIVADMVRNDMVTLAIAIFGFMNGILFCAFGKLIWLLENMVSNQNKIIKKLIPNDNNYEDSETPK